MSLVASTCHVYSSESGTESPGRLPMGKVIVEAFPLTQFLADWPEKMQPQSPTVSIETRRQELEAERLRLDERELRIKQERLDFEEDRLTLCRRVLDQQYANYFGEASMNTLSQACGVMQGINSSTAVQQEGSRQLEQKPDSLTQKPVKVWWDGDKRYYQGKILKRGVLIKYTDGEVGWASSYESDDESEEIVPCKRTPGCPKQAGHVGRCRAPCFSSGLNKRSLCQTVESNSSKRLRSEPRRLGHNDSWGLGAARDWH